MSDQAPPINKKAFIQDNRFALYGPSIDGGPQPCLKFSIFRGMPSITLFTNEERGGPETYVRADMGPFELSMFIELLRSCADATEAVQYDIVCRNHHRDENGDRSKEVFHIADVVLGRRADGTIYIGVRSADKTRPVREFPLQFPNPRYHGLTIKVAGEVENLAAMHSQIVARSWARAIDKVAFPEMVTSYEPPEYRGNQRQGGRGGNGGGGGGYRKGGGYSERQGNGYTGDRKGGSAPASSGRDPVDDLDDDIKF